MRISADDGCASDVRLAELCRKYEIELIIYLPVEWHSLAYAKGYEPLTYSDAVDLASEFEIGSHTITHRLLTQIPIEEAEYEILSPIAVLEDMLGSSFINKFAPPRGYTNEALTEYTLQYYEEQRLTKGQNLVHIHPDSGANGNKPWQEAINNNTTELWCHSWELDRYNLWEELENWMKQSKTNPAEFIDENSYS